MINAIRLFSLSGCSPDAGPIDGPSTILLGAHSSDNDPVALARSWVRAVVSNEICYRFTHILLCAHPAVIQIPYFSLRASRISYWPRPWRTEDESVFQSERAKRGSRHSMRWIREAASDGVSAICQHHYATRATASES